MLMKFLLSLIKFQIYLSWMNLIFTLPHSSIVSATHCRQVLKNFDVFYRLTCVLTATSADSMRAG